VKYSLISITCLALLSCRSTDIIDWPSNLPERSYFEAAYAADSTNQNVQSREEYLGWILSFYEGTLVAPIGWEEMQATVVAMAPITRSNDVDARLTELGQQIAAEWAKENDTRFIDSRMLSIWGSVLQLVVSPEQQFEAIQIISADVDALTRGSMLPSEVQDQRYEERLGLELFGDF